MHVTPQITFHNLPHSDAVETAVLHKIKHLEGCTEEVISCRVAIERPHHHRNKGNHFRVRIDLRLPGTELVVNRDPDEHQEFQDVYVAIRDAFDSMRRQLLSYLRKRHQHVKRHENTPLGRIAKLMNGEGYGFISTFDGRDVYFHRNSVLDREFDRLKIGQMVRFVEEQGVEGPQASTVHVVV